MNLVNRWRVFPLATWPLAMVLLLVAAAATAQERSAQERNPFAADAKAAEDGRLIFRLRCAACHGLTGSGGRAPDLTLGIYHAGAADADLYHIVANGVQGTEMPDFLARLGSQNVWRLVSYLRSIARRDTTGLTGNAAAGKELYQGKGSCARCHMVNGQGGRMGPDLSAVGRARSASYIRASLVDPDADLTPGYNTIIVVTKDGKKFTGTQRGYSDFSAQLIDGNGDYHSFEKDEVKSIDRKFQSLMPSYKHLSEKELDDLVAYLSGLGAGKAGASTGPAGPEGAHER